MNFPKLKFKVRFSRQGGWSSFVSKRLAFVTALAFLGVGPLPAQTPIATSGSSALITFANGSSVQVRTTKAKLPAVEIPAGETVGVQMLLPQAFAATSALVQALDGGVATQNVMVAADGTAFLEFRAGIQPGLYRILVTTRGESVLLQFWVQQP